MIGIVEEDLNLSSGDERSSFCYLMYFTTNQIYLALVSEN